MRNQTSFRLTTTLLPSDTTAKTTQVINKLDSTWAKFYPTFTEETVVLTNDDRTVMETTRATCTNWVLTFVKRGLSDDSSATPVENRKLTWNPWTLCFITAWASDWIDKDDDITWTWDQTYTGDLTSTGSATYRWRLVTEKWVEYPHFDSLEDLQDYADPFGWMFAVVDSDWELYRYNDVTDTWSVVTTSTPVQPTQASTTAIGTVRWATDTEFNNWTATWSYWELLVATPAQIKSVTPTMELHVTHIGTTSDDITKWQTATLSYNAPKAWFITVWLWQIWLSGGTKQNIFTNSAWSIAMTWHWVTKVSWDFTMYTRYTFAVPAWTFSLTLQFVNGATTNDSVYMEFEDYFYFW